MDKDEKEIIWALSTSVPLIILAILAPVLASYAFVKPELESLVIWFQRSGSITVMLAVWMEYNLSKVNEHINLSGIVVNDQTNLSNKYKTIYRITQYIGVLLAISGTIIWGYGDLLI